jgi:hypothetical protein
MTTPAQSATKAWIDVLKGKIADLELIASWASCVGLGKVRDYCRLAEHQLKEEIKWRDESC